MKKIVLAILLAGMMLGCNRVVMHGKERAIAPLVQSYPYPAKETFEAAKKALVLLGYEIREENAKGFLRTNWTSTQATSHYTELFDQHDYGTVGAYYRVEVRVKDRDGKSDLEISLPVKSLVAHQKSSYREERRILKKISDLLRSDDFEMTNLGTEP